MKKRYFNWVNFLLLWLALITIVLGIWFYNFQKNRSLNHMEQELQTIADLKVRQLAQWRIERLTDAELITNNILLRNEIQNWMATNDFKSQEKIRILLANQQTAKNYNDVLLVNPSGEILIGLNSPKMKLSADMAAGIVQSFFQEQPQFMDLHTGELFPEPHISVIAPLFIEKTSPARKKPLAAIVLVNYANYFLYPLIQSWPTPSRSGETLLVRKEGDQVLFLNDLRHRVDTALKLYIPLSSHDVPAVKAVHGELGIVSGKDYRGVEVIAVNSIVPETPWFLITKIDTNESMENWRFRSALILFMIGGIVFIIIGLQFFFWQFQQKKHLEAMLNMEKARQQEESARKESDRKYKLLVDHLPGMVYQCQNLPDWPFTFVSEGAYEISGYGKDEFENNTILFNDIIHPDDRKMVWDTVQSSIQEKMPFSMEYRINRKDGQQRWVFERGIAVTNQTAASQSILLQGFISDITARKQSEEEKIKLQSQLLQSQKLESIGRLAGGIAHDFNNMLQIIIGNVELIMASVDPSSEISQNLQEIHTVTKRTANLTKQLLAFARKQIIEEKVIDLNDAITKMVAMLKRLIGENIDLVWLPADKVWTIKMDTNQLDQILVNLCLNARDAIDRSGQVVIETANQVIDANYCHEHPEFVEGEFVCLMVSDNGRGMDKSILENIFDPFFTTKTISRGTGLGLSTVYGIVKQNKGFINVYSEPEKGSVFKLFFPRTNQAVTAEMKSVSTEIKSANDQQVILLVEDDSSILSLVKILLKRLGYLVLSCNKPSAALVLAAEFQGDIHLLITDVMMPEMNGRELSRQLSQLKPAMQTLFMSGYTANIISQQGILEKNAHFIGKPFSTHDMAAKISQILNPATIS
jgi:PAS domain S-box-containing protein